MKKIMYVTNENIDSPETTIRRRELIKSKPFLYKIYLNWYKQIYNSLLPEPGRKFLEIGSGGGFIKDLYPDFLTSDILPLPFVDYCFSAEKIPLENESLDGICMINVLHHIPQPALFLSEAQRLLKSGGRIVMVEPANSLWSRFVYKNFHHEPFDENASDWNVHMNGGPLSASNQAIPYLIFIRDMKKFEQQFPYLFVQKIKGHTAFTYVLSGGVSRRGLVPDFSYPVFNFFDQAAEIFPLLTSMFMTVVIEKR